MDYFNLSVSQINRIISEAPNYFEEKAKRKEENRKKHNEQTKRMMKTKRIMKIKREKRRLEDKAIMGRLEFF